MSPGDICICTHTREVHFGHDCSAVNCPCRQFVECGCGVELFESLRQIAQLSEEWKANHLGGIDIQRRRWQRLGEIAFSAISKAKNS